MTDAEVYDQWYETPRGRWIGHREAALIRRLLEPRPAESLLDVGCGTGFFTRTLATAISGRVTGVDISPDQVAQALCRDGTKLRYALADAQTLPFARNSFDLVTCVTALGFVKDENRAVCEILRVARRRFAIGLLGRRSFLWLQKGIRGGQGAYRGVRWHTATEARNLFTGLPVRNLRVFSAIFLPGGGPFAQAVERCFPVWFAGGAFLLIVGDKAGCNGPV